jgi:antitoxin MazE
MKSAIRKMGNSHGVIIPKPLLEEIGAKANDAVDVRVKKGKIIISPAKRDPRANWEDECKAIVAAGEDGLVWPEFGNKDDDKLVW